MSKQKEVVQGAPRVQKVKALLAAWVSGPFPITLWLTCTFTCTYDTAFSSCTVSTPRQIRKDWNQDC